jgi:hypothetical protein
VNPQPADGLLDRWIAPRALLLGVAVSFLACCLAGRLVSRRPVYRDFVRFHQRIAPETLHYPTASQLRTLGEAQAAPEQVLVVVGGSSVLYGVGQRPQEVWTRKLQTLLGERYRVLNLGMPAGGVMEFGGVAAEMLAVNHPKLIFITTMLVQGGGRSLGLYRYVFWDAVYKGLLPQDPEHDAWVARLKLQQFVENPGFPELKRQMEVDRFVYSRDLWTTLSYRRWSTVWAPLVQGSFRKARRQYEDSDPGPAIPFALRYPPANDAACMNIVRHWIATGEAPLQGPRPFLVTSAEEIFPPSSRPRTLVLFTQQSPYYVDRLTPVERAQYLSLFDRAPRLLEQAGIAALTVGRDWTVDDYYDLCHLSEAGGAKMAALVAPRVEEMAHRLGYLEEGR